MYKILLTTHGDLCSGMLETGKIFSDDLSFVKAIPFYTANDNYDAEKDLQDYIANLKEEDVLIILTDILWGSVNQKVYLKVNDAKNIHVVTGLNLPLFLEFLTANPNDINAEFVSEKVEKCRESLLYMREYEIESNDEDE